VGVWRDLAVRTANAGLAAWPRSRRPGYRREAPVYREETPVYREETPVYREERSVYRAETPADEVPPAPRYPTDGPYEDEYRR